jgi:ATP-dependent Clp protease ATP-binding subunit ClpB
MLSTLAGIEESHALQGRVLQNGISLYPFPLQEGDLSCPEPFPIAKDLPSKIDTQRSIHEEIIEKSKTLEARLRQKIYGQDEAVLQTANAIVRFAAGVNDPSTPIASLLYCGPSGVGKTELAKQLCLELYGNRSHFLRINMSEYVEPHSISRLIGAPPGYVGFESGGALANRLLDTPYLVVLLDEIEKAHPKILKLFMHIFDAGYFTSSRGEDVDCRKAIFILTSNIASAEIARLHQSGLSTQEILETIQPCLMEALSPEMYNRLDCMVFAPLSDSVFEMLIQKILGELKGRVAEAKGIEIYFDTTVIDYLKSYRLDPNLGARPLKRIVEKELATVIAKAIIDHTCKRGDFLFCSYMDGNIILEVIFTEETKRSNQ